MTLGAWIDQQARLSTGRVLAAVSATHLVKTREGFGQTVRPAPGSVLASPVPASYDPDPDYFFHWFRDSAIAIDALRVAFEQSWAGDEVFNKLDEFTQFSLDLLATDGALFLTTHDFRSCTAPFFQQYLRPDAAIAAVNDGSISGETRVNVDGTIDFIDWPRPQFDGPALRLLAMLRFWPHAPQRLRARMTTLISDDIAFTRAHLDAPSYDIWEEEKGEHAYTRLMQAQALHEAARWTSDAALASACAQDAARLDINLSSFWNAQDGYIRSRHPVAGGLPAKMLDIAVILGVIHAGRIEGRFSPRDPQAQATLQALEAIFRRDYIINANCGPELGAAFGRYADDRYYSGGAYFFATLAAAEFSYRLTELLALHERSTMDEARQHLRHGESIMARVRSVIPADGDMTEQFDKVTGAPASAKSLTWSHAAFITAAAARAKALRALQVRPAK